MASTFSTTLFITRVRFLTARWTTTLATEKANALLLAIPENRRFWKGRRASRSGSIVRRAAMSAQKSLQRRGLVAASPLDTKTRLWSLAVARQTRGPMRTRCSFQMVNGELFVGRARKVRCDTIVEID
jgi:hypothetical protein